MLFIICQSIFLIVDKVKKEGFMFSTAFGNIIDKILSIYGLK